MSVTSNNCFNFIFNASLFLFLFFVLILLSLYLVIICSVNFSNFCIYKINMWYTVMTGSLDAFPERMYLVMRFNF